MSSAVLILFFAIVIVGVLLLVIISVTRRPSHRLDTAKYQERWLSISNSVSDDPSSLQLAVLNADKLLDQAMRERGIAGDSLGERLKNGKSNFGDINAVWNAHKLRNRIAHEHDVKLTKHDVTKALAAFKAGLRDLGAL